MHEDQACRVYASSRFDSALGRYSFMMERREYRFCSAAARSRVTSFASCGDSGALVEKTLMTSLPCTHSRYAPLPINCRWCTAALVEVRAATVDAASVAQAATVDAVSFAQAAIAPR